MYVTVYILKFEFMFKLKCEFVFNLKLTFMIIIFYKYKLMKILNLF